MGVEFQPYMISRPSTAPDLAHSFSSETHTKLHQLIVGWTQETYPFPPDQHPYGGLEPLLLPWTDMSARKYAFAGGHFSQR